MKKMVLSLFVLALGNTAWGARSQVSLSELQRLAGADAVAAAVAVRTPSGAPVTKQRAGVSFDLSNFHDKNFSPLSHVCSMHVEVDREFLITTTIGQCQLVGLTAIFKCLGKSCIQMADFTNFAKNPLQLRLLDDGNFILLWGEITKYFRDE